MTASSRTRLFLDFESGQREGLPHPSSADNALVWISVFR